MSNSSFETFCFGCGRGTKYLSLIKPQIVFLIFCMFSPLPSRLHNYIFLKHTALPLQIKVSHRACCRDVGGDHCQGLPHAPSRKLKPSPTCLQESRVARVEILLDAWRPGSESLCPSSGGFGCELSGLMRATANVPCILRMPEPL